MVYKSIINTKCKLFKNPNLSSEIETEILFGEKIIILKKNKNWLYCRSIDDNCEGWIKESEICDPIETTHTIITKCTLVFDKPDIKSKFLKSLPFQAKVYKICENNEWVKIKLNKYKDGFVSKKHLRLKNKFFKDWTNVAKLFLNTPYLWGGKTYHGIDCSGLVQICLKSVGVKLPRNSSDQLKIKTKYLKDVSKIEKNCLIFSPGHVAIALSEKTIIHSNAFHMCVKTERLEKFINRNLNENFKLLKIKKVIL